MGYAIVSTDLLVTRAEVHRVDVNRVRNKISFLREKFRRSKTGDYWIAPSGSFNIPNKIYETPWEEIAKMGVDAFGKVSRDERQMSAFLFCKDGKLFDCNNGSDDARKLREFGLGDLTFIYGKKEFEEIGEELRIVFDKNYKTQEEVALSVHGVVSNFIAKRKDLRGVSTYLANPQVRRVARS